MRALFASGIVAILVIASGCSAAAGRTLNGTWDVTGLKDTPPDTSASMTFAGADKVTMNMDMKIMTMSMKIAVDGTYKVEGDTLDLTFTKADAQLIGGTPEEKKNFDMGKTQMEEGLVKSMADSKGSTIKWIDDKTVEMTSKGTTATLKKRG